MTKIALHLKDCVEGLARLSEATIDIVVTSPPYNIGVNYSSHKDSMPKRDYLEWMERVSGQVSRVLKSNGSVFLNVGHTSIEPMLDYEVAQAWSKSLKVQNRITWVKSISVAGHTHGHFKPLNSSRYLNRTNESVFHLTKNGNVTIDRLAAGCEFSDKSNIGRRGHKQDRRCDGNSWFIPYKTTTGDKGHPAAFPVELAERCIKLAGAAGAVVCDPFVGTGSTLVAAKNLGCDMAIGFDIDEKYLQIASERLLLVTRD